MTRAVERFLTWLEAKTLYPKPRDLVRRVPNVWNEASAKFTSWPATKLTTLSFRAPSKHLKWSDLSPSFRQDADAYLTLPCQSRSLRRAAECPEAPARRHHAPSAARAFAPGSFHLGSEWRRELPRSLIWLGRSSSRRFFAITTTKPIASPDAFVVALATTLIQVAQYHVGATAEEVGELKRLGRASFRPCLLTSPRRTRRSCGSWSPSGFAPSFCFFPSS